MHPKIEWEHLSITRSRPVDTVSQFDSTAVLIQFNHRQLFEQNYEKIDYMKDTSRKKSILNVIDMWFAMIERIIYRSKKCPGFNEATHKMFRNG